MSEIAFRFRMSANIKLFGELSVTVSGRPVEFSTRPTESLFAFLCTRAGRPISRVAAAETTWPDVELDKATNRLRTSLVHLRKSLLPWAPISANRQEVALSIEGCQIDLLEAERLYRRSRVAQDPGEERDLLREVLTLVSDDLLPEVQQEWLEPLRLHWAERRIECALRLASIGIGLEDYEMAEIESLRALSIDDFNEEAWSLYLRTMMQVDQSAQALERFGAARKRRLADLGFDFSSNLLELAKRVSSGPAKPVGDRSRFSVPAREAITNALEGSDPELLLPILASEAFRKEAHRNPNDAWKLICDVLEGTKGTDPSRLKVIRLLIFLTHVVGQHGVACDYAEWLAENMPEDSTDHLYAVSNLGFMNFELREWDAAWSYMRRYLELAEKHGLPREISLAKSQIASLNWHQGKLDLALEEYQSQAGQFAKDNSVTGIYNLSALSGNMGTILTIKGEWREAKGELMRAHSIALSNGFDYVKALTMAPLGMSMIMTGQRSEGRKFAALGLAHTYRSRYRRMHQISADYAAGALAASGYVRQGLAVLEAYTIFRAESHHARSVAEQQLADWIRQEFGQGLGGDARHTNFKPSEIVADSCDILESN